MSSKPTSGLFATQSFAGNLNRLRLAARLTQGELASFAALHRSEISLLERAKREPRLETILKLAGALSVDSSCLLEGVAWVPTADAGGHFELRRD